MDETTRAKESSTAAGLIFHENQPHSRRGFPAPKNGTFAFESESIDILGILNCAADSNKAYVDLQEACPADSDILTGRLPDVLPARLGDRALVELPAKGASPAAGWPAACPAA